MITVGIDLGTTNSAVAYHDGIKWQVIETAGGQNSLPSVVEISEDGSFMVGAQALRRVTRVDPKYIFSNIKRHMGMAFNDDEDNGFQITGDENGQRAFIGPNDKLYSPEELSAEILKVLKGMAERRIGKRVQGAVITVPAGFDNNQIAATQEAGRLAGFKKVHIKTEPEAAAIAYGLGRGKFTRVFVLDIGGGTEDAVLMDAGDQGFETRMKACNTNLGGLNFDYRVRQSVIEQLKSERDIDARESQISMMKLALGAETAKKELSEHTNTTIEVLNAVMDKSEGRMADVNQEYTREEFEAEVAPLIDSVMDIVRQVMDDAGRSTDQVDEVLLVGGMTRVPAIRKAVGEYFGEKKLRDNVPPDYAVVIGAATFAAELDKRLTSRMSHNDVTSMAFGLATEHDVFEQVIPAGAPFGWIQTVVVSTSDETQDTIPIRVIQGDDEKASNNSLLHRYDHKVKPGPRGSQTVEIEMMVDENGILMVAGNDNDTGEKFKVTP